MSILFVYFLSMLLIIVSFFAEDSNLTKAVYIIPSWIIFSMAICTDCIVRAIREGK